MSRFLFLGRPQDQTGVWSRLHESGAAVSQVEEESLHRCSDVCCVRLGGVTRGSRGAALRCELARSIRHVTHTAALLLRATIG